SRQKLVISLLAEAAFGQHGFVKQPQPRSHEAIERGCASEHPEGGSAQGVPQRQTFASGVVVLPFRRQGAARLTNKYQRCRRDKQDQRQCDFGPGLAPAGIAHYAADDRERARKENAQEHGIDAHGKTDASIERFPYDRDACDRKRALTERAGGKDQYKESRDSARETAHSPYDEA